MIYDVSPSAKADGMPAEGKITHFNSNIFGFSKIVLTYAITH
jgi:hypothetical protein